MNRFSKILKRKIDAVSKVEFSEFEAEDSDSAFPCGRPLNPQTIKKSVKELIRTANQPSSRDKCAKYIKDNNDKNCADLGSTDPANAMPYLRFTVARLACERYAESVVNALPPGTSDAAKAEAKRKATCDAINFIRYRSPGVLPGELTTLPNPVPGTNSRPIEPGQMTTDLINAFNEGFNYMCMHKIVQQMEQLDEYAAMPALSCF